MAEVTKDVSKLGEKKAEITINFYENGLGIDATKTGVTKSQIVRGALALLGEVGKDDLNNIGENLATYEVMVRMLKKAKDELIKNEGGKCQGSED